MRSTRTGTDDESTRDRLLEAAARAVADRGFAGATVREICRRAGTNVGAVNYHFGSKDHLLGQSLRWACSQVPEDPWFHGSTTGDAREDLRAAISAFARRILGLREEWHMRLMMRAISEPNPALDVVVRDVIEPRVRTLELTLARWMPDAEPRVLRLHALSVIGQIAYYRFAGPLALRLLGERSVTQQVAEEISAHVFAFTERSLAALPSRTPRREPLP